MTVLNNRKQMTKNVLILPEKQGVVLPKKYSNFANVFSKINADIFPKHSMYNLAIETKKEKNFYFGFMYNHSRIELQTLQDYINKILAKDFTTLFKSFFRASMLFTKKKNGDLRLCINYQGLNAITLKNKYLLPLIQILLNILIKSWFFTKLDIIVAYNPFCIRKSNK